MLIWVNTVFPTLLGSPYSAIWPPFISFVDVRGGVNFQQTHVGSQSVQQGIPQPADNVLKKHTKHPSSCIVADYNCLAALILPIHKCR